MGAFKQRSIRPNQTKRSTPYEGDDIAEWIKQNRSHSTTSNAFKDAKYSEWFEKDPEMSDMKQFTYELLWFGVPLIMFVLFLVACILKAANVF